MPKVSTFSKTALSSFASVRQVRRVLSKPEMERQSAVENWENEGGRFPEFAPLRHPSSVVVTGPDQLADEIDQLTKALASDFANGCVGKRYNTYQHRSRVIRQLTACRAALCSGPLLLELNRQRDCRLP